jgi:PDDEXK-like domain of unknown function (DUF3799)/SAP domain
MSAAAEELAPALGAAPTKTGVYPNVPNEAYHTGDGISSTGIKRMLVSPLHYKDRIDLARERAAKGLPSESTPTLEFGNKYHQLILEPELFAKTYMGPVDPAALKGALKTAPDMKAECKRQGLPVGGSKGDLIARLKEAYPQTRFYEEVLLEAAGGKRIIDADDWERLMGMQKMLLAHPSIGGLFTKGEAEISVYWTDEETGVLCKIRPDWILPIEVGPKQHKHMLIDLKSAIDASREGFEKAVYNFGYHISAAMYLEGWEKATGEDLSGYFLFVGQEHQRPYALAPYPIDDEALAIGRDRFHEALRTYAACLETGEYPGYPAHFQPVGLPSWAIRREQNR